MSKAKITFLLRIRNFISLAIDMAILIALIALCSHLRILKILYPTYLDSITSISGHDQRGQDYVALDLQDLHYTGYQAIQDGKTGYYHYIIKDDRCYFLILKTSDTTPRYIKARVTKADGSTTKLIKEFARDINWSENELERFSSPLIIDENAYDEKLIKALEILLILCFSILVAHLIILISGIIYPPIALYVLHNNNYFMVPKRLKDAQRELDEGVIYSQGNIRLTKNYLIGLSYRNICIIPLENITWAYYHSVLRRSLVIKHDITYTLRVVSNTRRIYTIQGQKKGDCVEVLEILQTMYPEIMIGYNTT